MPPDLEARLEGTDRALRSMLDEVADRIEEKASLPFRSSYVYGQGDVLVKGSPSYIPPGLRMANGHPELLNHELGHVGSMSVMTSDRTGKDKKHHHHERSGSVIELHRDVLQQEPVRVRSRQNNYVHHEELKMPMINDKSNRARLQRLHGVKNIHIKNTEPL